MPKQTSRQGAQAPLRCAPAIRLLLLPDAMNPDGGPRPALLLPNPRAGKPLLRAFPSIAAALAAKRSLEAPR